LKYGKRKYGINLVWTDSTANPIRIERDNPRDHRDLKVGERVAVHVSGGGYLKYKKRSWGINLVWSDVPVLEWEIRSPDPGTIVESDHFYGLYNRRIGDYVVYCKRSWGINLRWLSDCKDRTGADGAGPYTLSFFVQAQPIVQGIRPYLLAWNPGPGRRLTGLRVGTGVGVPSFVAHFMKPGQPFSACGSPGASVSLQDGETATPAQLAALFGSATPQAPLTFLACLTIANPGTPINSFPVTITWTAP
jgi:hypothetical protein